MMTEDATYGGGGDVENPEAVFAANDAPTSSKAAAVYGGGNVPNKKAKVIALSAFLLVAVVLAIVLGVTLGPSGGESAANVSTDAGTGGEPSAANSTAVVTLDATTTTSTSPSTSSAISSPSSSTLSSSATTTATAVPDTTTAATVAPDATTSTSSTLPSSAGTTEATEAPKDEGTGTTESPDSETTAATVPADDPVPVVYRQEFLRSSGPLASRVRIANPGVANGYASCDELRGDIEDALRYYADSIIVQQSEYDWYEKCDPNPDWGRPLPPVAYSPTAEMAFAAEESAAAPPTAEMDSSAQGKAPEKVSEDSYGTNNQVLGVDEADIAKSDGEYVFAAYGDALYAWRAENGTKGVSITKMPYEKANCTQDIKPPPPYYEPQLIIEDEDVAVDVIAEPLLIIEDEDVAVDVASASPPSSAATASARGGKRHEPSRHQRDLSMMIRPPYWDPCYTPKPRIVSLLLHGSRLTAIVSEPERTRHSYYGFLEEPDEEQSVLNDGVKLTVRIYDISTVPDNGDPLVLLAEKDINGKYRDARSVDDTGFIITTSSVNTGLFARKLWRSEPEYCGMNATEYAVRAAEHAVNLTVPFMERMVNELQLQLDGTCDSIFQVAAMQSGDSVKVHSNGDMLGQFVQVQSFDMTEDFSNTEKLITTKQAGGFSSGWLNTVYASQGLVATLSNGGTYNRDTGEWEQSTFILGFDTTGSAPRPFAYAEVPGRPLNQYSVDFYDGHLRLVTQEWRRRSWNTDTPASPRSSTLNKIVVLKVPGAGEGTEMRLVGETGHVGKANEQVFSVRFIKDKAYIVTFERIDPFYIFDMSNHSMPTKLGELEIPGFSSYLHPLEIDGVPFIMGVGEHVDEVTNWRTGVKISLFDVSNSSNPTESAVYVDEGAYSTVGNDFKAFRYLPQSKKLILPKSEYSRMSQTGFDGFVVYDISKEEIKPSYEIQHASSYDMYNYCWSSSRMPARSFVFQSKLTTILTHSVMSTDLDSGEKLWGLNLDEGNIVCSPYF